MILDGWLTRRSEYYGLWTIIFAVLYGAATYLFEPPSWIWIAVTSLFLIKDLLDEYLINSGSSSLAYADIEHNPSNIVILAFSALGVISLEGTTFSVSNALLIPGLAFVDLLLDGSQDLKLEEYWPL